MFKIVVWFFNLVAEFIFYTTERPVIVLLLMAFFTMGCYSLLVFLKVF